MSQTVAIFTSAYRNLNSKKLFWISLMISGLVVGTFACLGINRDGLKLLFWQWDNPYANTTIISASEFYKLAFVKMGSGFWLSWMATILALISTAGIFPDLISSGAVDMMVCRPICRLRLFITEYLAGLLFVTLQVTLFTAASFLVIGLRGGVWEPGMFVAVPVVVCFFSYLFAVCVLLGVLTRSTVAALLLTLLFWLFVFTLGKAEEGIATYQTVSRRQQAFNAQPFPHEPRPGPGRPVGGPARAWPAPAAQTSDSGGGALEIARQALCALRVALPKTTETTDLLERWLTKLADLPKESIAPREGSADSLSRDLVQITYSRSPGAILGSSLGFELFVLACAGWVFCRRDY